MIPLFAVDHLEPTPGYLRLHAPHFENRWCGLSWFGLRGQTFFNRKPKFQTEYVKAWKMWEFTRQEGSQEKCYLVALLGSRVFETTHCDWTSGNLSLCFNKFDHLIYLIYMSLESQLLTWYTQHLTWPQVWSDLFICGRHKDRQQQSHTHIPSHLKLAAVATWRFSHGLKDSPTNPCPGWEECTLWRGLHSVLTEDLYPSNRAPSSCAAVHRG